MTRMTADRNAAGETAPGKPISPAQSTIDALLALIEEGGWVAGQQLPSQRQLAERLGVSRPTVREALVALGTMGLITIRPGRGIFLQHHPLETGPAAGDGRFWEDGGQPPSRMVQMFQFRYVVEPAVAGLAAQNATAAQIEDLKQLVTRMRETLDRQDVTELSRLDGAFHQQVVEAANNPFFTKALAPTLGLVIESQQPAATHPEEVVAEHEAIVEALLSHASWKARRTMRQHINATLEREHITLDMSR